MHGSNRDPWQGLRGNLLLQSLSAHDALALAPQLRRVALPVGARLGADDLLQTQVYFPETLVVCLGVAADSGGDFEIGLVGREGMIGWDALLDCEGGRHCGKVQLSGGTALTISAQRLCMIAAHSVTMTAALLRFGHVFAIQMAGTLVSNLRDPYERRLCRWLLMFHDRVDGGELAVTHDTLATLLNARRATVTELLHVLEGDLILRCTRGRIVIRDRPALEMRAAHAYGAAERTYRAMIGSFGKAA